jgi:hypothetical protein
MQLTVNKPTTVIASAIRVSVAVRYNEEDIPNDFPLRTGDMWNGTINISTGLIAEWPPEANAEGGYELHMKVTDNGSYYLLDDEGNELAKRENEYVPSCIPGKYGDYIQLDISPCGVVSNWRSYCTDDHVRDSFFFDDE